MTERDRPINPETGIAYQRFDTHTLRSAVSVALQAGGTDLHRTLVSFNPEATMTITARELLKVISSVADKLKQDLLRTDQNAVMLRNDIDQIYKVSRDLQSRVSELERKPSGTLTPKSRTKAAEKLPGTSFTSSVGTDYIVSPASGDHLPLEVSCVHCGRKRSRFNTCQCVLESRATGHARQSECMECDHEVPMGEAYRYIYDFPNREPMVWDGHRVCVLPMRQPCGSFDASRQKSVCGTCGWCEDEHPKTTTRVDHGGPGEKRRTAL